MKIHTDNTAASKPLSNNSKFNFSKLPTFLLYILNWIPFCDTDRCTIIFILNTVFTILFHLLGEMTSILIIYQTRVKLHDVPAPRIFVASLICVGIFPFVNATLSLFKSWRKTGTRKVLKIIHENNCQSTLLSPNSKMFITIMNLFVVIGLVHKVTETGTTFGSTYAIVMEGHNHFIKSVITRKAIAYAALIYRFYLETLWILFPAFLFYIFIQLFSMLDHLQKSLEINITNGTIYTNNTFDNFTNRIKYLFGIISLVDETFNFNIGVYLMMAVINSSAEPYLLISMGDCFTSAAFIAMILFDLLTIFLIMLLAAIVNSKVRLQMKLLHLTSRLCFKMLDVLH